MSKNKEFNRQDPSSKPYTFDRVVRYIITALVVAAIFWLLTVLKSVILPFLIAWLIAYILEPFVQYNRRILGVKNRWLPITITLFEAILLMCAIGIFLMPSIMHEARQVAAFIAQYTRDGVQVPFIPASVHDFLLRNIDFETIARQLTREDIGNIMEVLGSVLSGGMSMIMRIIDLFFIFLYVIFIMLDYEKLLSGAKRLVPPKYRKIVFRLANDIKTSMNHYFRGQALVAFIVGILFCIGFSIVGLPLAIVMGLFIGVLNMVPYLQLISLIPTTILCLVSSVDTGIDFWSLWISCMIVYIVVQCIQDLFLTPRIMGKSMGLNPALILLSLSVWGTLLGFIGLIIALPLTTLLLAYYDMYITSCEVCGTPRQRRAAARALKKITERP